MRWWTHRDTWMCGAGWAGLVSLIYLGSLVTFESPTASGCSGGSTSSPAPNDHFGVQLLVASLSVGRNAFFTVSGTAEGLATEAPLERVSIDVKTEAGEPVSGVASIVDDLWYAGDTRRHVLIGWQAAETRTVGEILVATVVVNNANGGSHQSLSLEVSEELPALAEPELAFRDWGYVTTDSGAAQDCAAERPCVYGAQFGSETRRLTQVTLDLPRPWTPIAVAWKYSFEAVPNYPQPIELPQSYVGQGPTLDKAWTAKVRFESQADEYCIRILVTDLLGGQQRAVERCGAPEPGVPEIVEDAISSCTSASIPPEDLERWCLALRNLRPECEAFSAPGTAGASGIAGNGGQLDGRAITDSRSSRACSLAGAPSPGSNLALGAWTFLMLLAARRRKQRDAMSLTSRPRRSREAPASASSFV
jgi:hypothetical protein